MKGIVVDICANRAAILKNDGTFAEVANRNYHIGQKISRVHFRYAKYLTGAACFVLLVITSIAGYRFYNTAYSYLYVDINPSLRLDLNFFDKVISCTPLNEDARRLHIEYGNTEKTIEGILSECEQKGYLTAENNEIEINVMSNHKAVADSIQAVSDTCADSPYTINVGETTKSKSTQANTLGISVQKLNAIERYSEVFGGDVADNAEKLKDSSAKEINKSVIEEKNKPHSEPPSPAAPSETEPSEKPDKITPKPGQPKPDKSVNKTKSNQGSSADKKAPERGKVDKSDENPVKPEKPDKFSEQDKNPGNNSAKKDNGANEKDNRGQRAKQDRENAGYSSPPEPSDGNAAEKYKNESKEKDDNEHRRKPDKKDKTGVGTDH